MFADYVVYHPERKIIQIYTYTKFKQESWIMESKTVLKYGVSVATIPYSALVVILPL